MEEKSLEQQLAEAKARNTELVKAHYESEAKARADAEALYAKTYPPSLIKALNDYFYYAIMLKSGLIISFIEAAYISADWVRLKQPQFHANLEELQACSTFESALFERGLELRVSEIVWCVDALNGS